MKKKKELLLCLVYFISLQAFAQINNSELIGKWVEVHKEMKDGSKYHDAYRKHYPSVFIFQKNEFFITSVSFLKLPKLSFASPVASGITYSLDKNRIICPGSFYTIEKMSSDTLVISENIQDIDVDKLKRHFLVRKESLEKQEKNKLKTEPNITATPFFTPVLEQKIIYKSREEGIAFAKSFSKNHYRGKGRIILDLKAKKTEVIIDSITLQKDIDKEIKLIKKTQESNFKDWEFDNFKEFNTVEIPFIFINREKPKVIGLQTTYFTDDISSFDTPFNLLYEDEKKSHEHFINGIRSLQNKNYKDAIKYFSDAYSLNLENLDALYNIASCYLLNEDLENACKVWKKISDFGQVTGKKLYTENCNSVKKNEISPSSN